MDLPDRVQQAKEALEIYGRLSNTVEQAQCLIELAWLLHGDEQLDPAAEATSRAIDLIPEKDNRFPIRRFRLLKAVQKATRVLACPLG